MGAWAVGSFGNDAPGDWVVELTNNPTYEFLREAFLSSIDMPYDSEMNASAVAAAEVICIIEGKLPADNKEVERNMSAAILPLRQERIPSDLKPLAIDCLNTILSNSELKELWEDSEAWISEVKRLIHRLKE